MGCATSAQPRNLVSRFFWVAQPENSKLNFLFQELQQLVVVVAHKWIETAGFWLGILAENS